MTERWTPALLGSNLKVWLAADTITGLNDGDPIDAWADASSSGNDAVAEFPWTRPTYCTNQINGLPSVSFDPTVLGQYLAFPGVSGTALSETVIAVCRRDAGTMMSLAGDSDVTVFPAHGWYVDTASDDQWRYSSLGEGYVGMSSATLPVGQVSVVSLSFDKPDRAYGSGSITFAVNGVRDTDTDNWTVGATDTLSMEVGGIWNGQSGWHGLIPEFLVFQGSATLDDVHRVEGYLAHKYAIALPATHPYALLPPLLLPPCPTCGQTLVFERDDDILGWVWKCLNGHYWRQDPVLGWLPVDPPTPMTATRLWTPADLSLLAWYDASQFGALSSGQPIEAWPDASGQGHDAVAAGSLRADYDPVGVNGRPALHFDTPLTHYETDIPASRVNETVMAVIALSDLTGYVAADIIAPTGVSGQDGGTEYGILRGPNAALMLYLDPASWAAPGATYVTEFTVSPGPVTVPLDTPTIVGWTTRLNDTGAFYRDGVTESFTENSEADPDYTSDFFDVNGYSSNRMQIGCWQDWSGPFTGMIAEIGITQVALGAADIARWQGYLHHKYGIALTASHTYATAAPTITVYAGAGEPVLVYEES